MSHMDYDLIQAAPTFLSPIHDREIDFRNHKIARIENLTLTKDQNDALDLTDNDLRMLDNFPLLLRLKTILCANNRIARIDPELSNYLPNLQVLMMNNNQMQEMGDLLPLEQLVNLNFLSLIDNPVVLKANYREFVIHKCPSILVLDFQKVTEKERALAALKFSGADGVALLASLCSKQSMIDISNVAPKKAATKYQGPTPEETLRIRNAIKNAKTLEEIGALEKLLQGGAIPDS